MTVSYDEEDEALMATIRAAKKDLRRYMRQTLSQLSSDSLTQQCERVDITLVDRKCAEARVQPTM